VLSLYSAVAL